MLRPVSSSSKFNSLRVSDWLRRCPVSHAGALCKARLSGSILRMRQHSRRKAGRAKLRFKFNGGLSVGIKYFQFGLIARIGFGNQRGGFGIEFARIERDDANGQFQTAHGIGNDHIFNRKAGCEHGLRIAYGNVLQTVLQSGSQLRQAAAFGIIGFRDFPELWAE